MLVPDETITTWVDIGDVLDARWGAFRAHVSQISDENPFVRFGRDALRDFWSREAFVRRESRVAAPDHETDLFAGLEGRTPGAFGWG
jgi:LmbE family N-acetylglucosaminyl deacetylase